MALPGTIIAPASAPGRSARALIRASGPAARELASTVFGAAPSGRHAGAGRIGLEPDLGLPVLAAFAPAPASYTGEDTLEIALPGGPALVPRVLAVLMTHPGCRPAEPGEFTARAYLNGRLTLDQAEGVQAVVAARSTEELREASRLLAGETGAAYRRWADELATLLALVEAGIDFTDQESVVPITPQHLHERVVGLSRDVRRALGGGSGRRATDHLPLVVLAGEPNAGKSALFNTLLGRRRAVVSGLAGTTRDVLREELPLSRWAPGAEPVELADMAGLDDAPTGEVSASAQAASRRVLTEADVVLHCDPTGRFVPLPGVTAPVLRVRTKADLPGPSLGVGILAVCALDGWNLAALARAIADAAWGRAPAAGGSVVPRHRRSLERAACALDAAADAVDPTAGSLTSPETVADGLRHALDALGELVGAVPPDDVLGRVFAAFCIGK